MPVPLVVIIAALPKCPACLAAYGSLFAASWVATFLTGPFAMLMAVASILLFVTFAIVRRRLVFGLTGVLAVVSIYWLGRGLGYGWAHPLGLALLLAGSVHEITEILRQRRRQSLASRGTSCPSR